MLSNRSLSPQSRPLGEGTSAEVWLLHLESRKKKKNQLYSPEVSLRIYLPVLPGHKG